MKTDTTLRINRRQYREFAEITKAAGAALDLSTFNQMAGNWGMCSFMALPVCGDVRDTTPSWQERVMVTLSTSIKSSAFRACSRPEMDWSALEDDEIYPFVLWHEVGHLVDNFNCLAAMYMDGREVGIACHRRIVAVNEVLADRYAWNKVRPGEPLPVSEAGLKRHDKLMEDMQFLDQHLPRLEPTKRPLRSGQYRDVAETMLRSPQKAAFIGPEVSDALIEDRMRRAAQIRRAAH